MIINEKILNDVRTISTEIDKKNVLASELMRIAKERFGETSLSIERNIKGSGMKFIQVKQNDLWTEIYHLGMDSQAGKVLREQHPAVIKAFDSVNKSVDELNTIATLHLGLQGYQKVSLKDIINISEAIAEMKVRKLVNAESLINVEVKVGGDNLNK